MLDSVFEKWNDLCRVAATGVLMTTNRVLVKRVEGLNSQVKTLVSNLAAAENKLSTYDNLVGKLNKTIQELQADNQSLRADSGVVSKETIHDQEVQIEDLRRINRELQEKHDDLARRRRATKAEHQLAENIKSHFSACGSMRVKIAADGSQSSYNLGPLSVPADVLLEWYMRRLSDGMDGQAMPEPFTATVVEDKG